MTDEEMRHGYGYGFQIDCKCPELGDIFIQRDVIYIVIGKDGYRLVTSSIYDGESNITFFSPLEEVGHYTDLKVIGNILGAVTNTDEYERRHPSKREFKFLGERDINNA